MKLRLVNNEIKEILNSEISAEAKLVTTSPVQTKYIRIIFHSQYSAEDVMDMNREAYLYWADCFYDDVKDARQDDKITIDGIEYNIESIENRTDSWCILRLTRV